MREFDEPPGFGVGLRWRRGWVWGLLILSLTGTLADDGSPVVLVDAVGAKVTHPSNAERPISVGSQVDLLKPDRYEFYTFDETGDLVKRLMTLAEIQEIVASGDEGGVAIIPSDSSYEDPTSPTEEPALDAVVSSVQDVLQSQLQQFQSQPQSDSFSSLDTPDVSQHWSHILPAVFGEPSDTEIVTEKNTAELTTARDDIMSTTAETATVNFTSTTQSFTDKTLPSSKQPTTNGIVFISSSNRPSTTTEKNIVYLPFSKNPTTTTEQLPVTSNDVPMFDMSESMNQIAIGLGDTPSFTEVINESTVTTLPSTAKSTGYTTEQIMAARPSPPQQYVTTGKIPQTVVSTTVSSSTPFYKPVEIEAIELSESVSNLLSQISQDPLEAIANIDAIDKISLKSDINRYDISSIKRKDDGILLEADAVDEKVSQKEGEGLLIETTTIQSSLASSALQVVNSSSEILSGLQNKTVITTPLPLLTKKEKLEDKNSQETINYIKLPLLTTPKPKPAEVMLNISNTIPKLPTSNYSTNNNISEYILINANITNNSSLNSFILVKPKLPSPTKNNVIKEDSLKNNTTSINNDFINIVEIPEINNNSIIQTNEKINKTILGTLHDIKITPQLPHSNLEIEKLENLTKPNYQSQENSSDISSHTKNKTLVNQPITETYTEVISITKSTPSIVKNGTVSNNTKQSFLNTTNTTKNEIALINISQPAQKNNSLQSNLLNSDKNDKFSNIPVKNFPNNLSVVILNNTTKATDLQGNMTLVIPTPAPVTTASKKTTLTPSTTASLKLEDNLQSNKTKVQKYEKNKNDLKDKYEERNNTWKLVSTVKPNDGVKNVTNMKLAGVTSSKPLNALRPRPVADKTSNKFVNLEDVPQENQGLEATTKNLNEDIYQFAELCNELAFKYWNAVISEGIDEKRSVVVSPFAITSLLAMIFMGARGSTSGEMNEILKLDDMVTFNPHFIMKNVTESIEQARNQGVATSAFVRQLYSDRSKGKILGFFKDRAQQFYGAHVEEINFKLVSDVIRRRTNLLVKRHTWGKIPEYIKSNNIVLKTPLAAFSANIFQTECSGVSTSGRDAEMYFAVSPSVRQRRLVPVPAAVERRGFFAGYEPALDATVAALSPDSAVSLILAMPGQLGRAAAADGDSDDALAELSRELTQSPLAWKRLLRAMALRPGLELQFPRFQHRSAIDSGAALRRMGLKELFDSERADLRGLSSTGRSINELFLADLLEVTTVGTCSETGVGGPGDSRHSEVYPAETGASSSRKRRALYRERAPLPLHLRPRQARRPLPESPPAPAPRLRFDRPFLYFVRHNPTGLILYVGRYNPRLLP